MFIFNKIIKILIINGPNLNFLQKREKIYSNISFKKLKKELNNYSKNYFKLIFFNSNCEGKIINFLQKNLNNDFLIINPAAYSHYSLSLLDCLKIFQGKIIEVHITNLYKREFFRHKSLISFNSNVIISGMNVLGYYNAIDYIFEICF
ncbi:type II 3-dehydroquinate dehydratase [Candidatus Carsonella ruddii]|uniref:type II 3-dehydroquinate dehydratase n=1 Tax=Carsonella ruddii TaxID=114186 RepID=UPI003D9A75F5